MGSAETSRRKEDPQKVQGTEARGNGLSDRRLAESRGWRRRGWRDGH